MSCGDKNCQTCAKLRHPANAAQRKALEEHLKKNPMPRQRG